MGLSTPGQGLFQLRFWDFSSNSIPYLTTDSQALNLGISCLVSWENVEQTPTVVSKDRVCFPQESISLDYSSGIQEGRTYLPSPIFVRLCGLIQLWTPINVLNNDCPYQGFRSWTSSLHVNKRKDRLPLRLFRDTCSQPWSHLKVKPNR